MYYIRGRKFKKFVLGNSSGYALPLVLTLLALGSVATIPFLLQLDTGAKGVSVIRDLTVNSYTANSGIENARWQMQFGASNGPINQLSQSTPSYSYSYNVNNLTTYVTVNWVPPMPSPSPTPPPGGSQSDHAEVAYTIVPSNLLPGQTTVATVTITMENIGDNKIKFTQILDLLPPGFTYIAGSSSGHTTANPTTQMISGQQKLTWNFGVPGDSLNSGETIQQVFRVSATPPEGVYYNSAWIVFDTGGAGTVYAGEGTTVVAQYRKFDVTSKIGKKTLKIRFGRNDTKVIELDREEY